MERGAIQELVRRWLQDAIGGRKLEVFDELLSVDSAPFKQRAAAIHAAFSDLQTSVDELLIDGDNIAWRWSVSGTHVGDFGGVAPTGRRVTLQGVNFQRLEGGRVAQHWTLADTAGVLQQLRRSDA